MTFLFAAGLWALPLAAAPLLLHLLFRRRAPLVPFSTLRFVVQSMRHTAARRRLRRWLLLGCRTLLLLLLIGALAQPAWRASGAVRGAQRSMLAAIVVDTSYSMLLRQGRSTLLDQADAAVRDLLRNDLAGTKVNLFTSEPTAASLLPRDAAAVLDEWAPLRPQPAAAPLVDRVAAAAQLLGDQMAERKQLIVISDFQSREFPHPLPTVPGAQTLLLDLHPDRAHSAGITSVSISPTQPLPGVGSEAVVEVTGPPSDSRAVELKVTTTGGAILSSAGPTMANLDAGGHDSIRFPLSLASQQWTLLSASLTANDDMPWDNTRSSLVELPPRQSVNVICQPPGSAPDAERFVRLALDPSEGALAAWPIAVQSGSSASNAGARSIVALLSAWPTASQAATWHSIAAGGGSIVLFLRPGLAATWNALPPAERAMLTELLPSPPAADSLQDSRSAAIAAPSDPLLQGLATEPAQWSGIVVRQLVGLSSGANGAAAVLNAAPLEPTPSSRLAGLLYRKPIGAGVCFTVATLPDDAYTNFATQPAFLPLLVRMALASRAASTAPLNAEIGQPLLLPAAAPGVGSATQVQVESPRHEVYRIGISGDSTHRHFVFDQSDEPGIYTWRPVTAASRAAEPIALTNMQLPAAESDLTYRPAAAIVSPAAAADTVVARSIAELDEKLTAQAAPRPEWSLPIAAVMFLLCIEALLGSGAVGGRRSGRPAAAAAVPGDHGVVASRIS